MANDYNRGQSQGSQGTSKEPLGDIVKSAIHQGEDRLKDIAANAKDHIKEGQEQVTKLVKNVDEQVRQNPWPTLGIVAVGALALGFLLSKTRK